MSEREEAYEEIAVALLREARRYQEDDGTPGPLATAWGWGSIAGTLRKLAAEMRKIGRETAGDDGISDDEACPDCGHDSCVCGDPDYHCRSCGRLSDCIDNGLCGMCFELQGGILLSGQ